MPRVQSLVSLLLLAALATGCATSHGTQVVERPTEEPQLESTAFELTAAPSAIDASPLRLVLERVERYRVRHGGEKATVETYQAYQAYHELWEVPFGAVVAGTALAFFFLDGSDEMFATGLVMLNPARNVGHGDMLQRDIASEPLPPREEERIVRIPMPGARVRVALRGGATRSFETDASGAIEVPLPALLDRPLRSAPDRLLAEAAHPEMGEAQARAVIPVEPDLGRRLAVAAPAALVLAKPGRPIGEVAEAVFTLKRLGFATFAADRQEAALAAATRAPDCRLGAGSEGWIYVSGGCRNGLAHGSGDAYDAASERRLRGRFVDGQLVAGGYEDVSGLALSGDWKGFRLHGRGRHLERGELQYEGGYAAGERHGDGTCLFEGRFERCEHRAGQRVDAVFVMRAELRESRAELARMQAEQKRMLEAQAEEARRIEAERVALERRRAEEARRREAAAQQASSGPSFGQVMAFGLGAAVVGAADVPMEMKADMTGALAQDIFTDTNGTALQQVQEKYAVAPASPGVGSSEGLGAGSTATGTGTGTGGASSTGSGGYQDATIRVSCSSNPIPIRFKTAQCRAALEAFAQAMACNEISTPERMEAVESRCMRDCGHRQCLQ
ncbi:MAG: hypothetical protein H6748_03680 [Spirochaetaceae bacterium]|nr:hypothetical protein [Spirochaetaceae bacterium]